MDVYQEIRRLQLEGVVSKREAARRLGISRNTVKKYWDGDVVPWDKKPYIREANVITGEIRKSPSRFMFSSSANHGVKFMASCGHTCRRSVISFSIPSVVGCQS